MPLRPPLSRRSALAGLGALAAGGTGLLALSSEPTTAATVTADTIDVADGTVRQADGDLASVWLRLGGSWSYTSQEVEPNGYRLDLLVSPDASPRDYNRIAREEGAVFGYDEAKQFSILGEVTSHAGFAPSDWAAPDAGTKTAVPVRVRVVFSVLDGDFVLASATADDIATLVLENDSVAISLGVEGTGSFDVQGNDSDPTPT